MSKPQKICATCCHFHYCRNDAEGGYDAWCGKGNWEEPDITAYELQESIDCDDWQGEGESDETV